MSNSHSSIHEIFASRKNHCSSDRITLSDTAKIYYWGMLKKPPAAFPGFAEAARTDIVTILPYSRTGSTLRASKRLRPCWTNFFEHSLSLMSVAVLKHLWPMNMKYSTGPEEEIEQATLSPSPRYAANREKLKSFMKFVTRSPK